MMIKAANLIMLDNRGHKKNVGTKIFEAFSDDQFENKHSNKIYDSVPHLSSRGFNDFRYFLEFNAAEINTAADCDIHCTTILFCFPDNQAEMESFAKQIEYVEAVKKYRGDNLPFNIIPVYSDNSEFHAKLIADLFKRYPDFCREAISFDFDEKNYKPLFKQVHEVSVVNSVYRELINATSGLKKLSKELSKCYHDKHGMLQWDTWTGNHTGDTGEALNPIGMKIYALTTDLDKAKSFRTKLDLFNYLNLQRSDIQSNLSAIKKLINQRGLSLPYSVKAILANVIYSILNIFAFCSIVGTTYAREQFKQNAENHGGMFRMFKFVPTNTLDEVQASIVSAERALSMKR